MNAIVPLNVSALRVNANDAGQIASRFKGRTAVFEQMPWKASQQQASTGSAIYHPLNGDSPSPNTLGVGIHVHWELPDYFTQGVQPPGGGRVRFPQCPNRWLVVRSLSMFDSGSGTYGAPVVTTFLVESDYIGCRLEVDPWGVYRPTISVPLTAPASCDPSQRGRQPYMYMGRVLDFASWDPSSESPDDYLPSRTGEDGEPLYLTSIGFVGPGFSNYYPECCSVFGFWDHFKDAPGVYGPINHDSPIQFKVSYQVAGWIDPGAADPMAGIAASVKTEYDRYVTQCKAQGVPVSKTPVDVFAALTGRHLRWTFNLEDVGYTLNPDQTLASLEAPSGTLVAGVIQEVVWDMLTDPAMYFLSNPAAPPNEAYRWTDTIRLAAGNTPTEALSAILKSDVRPASSDSAVLKNYEYLLDALQLGLLRDLESEHDRLIHLDEALHSKAFSAREGGLTWIVAPLPSDPGAPARPDSEVTLPLDLAEELALLNRAQKAYDQGRAALDQSRKQLYMDWYRYVTIYVTNKADPYVTLSELVAFLHTPQGGELNAVVEQGNAAGILRYKQDPVSGEVTGLYPPAGTGSLADAVYDQYQIMARALELYPDWVLVAAPAASFVLPTDPVLLMEGRRLEPVRRNGPARDIRVRTSLDLLSSLTVAYAGRTFQVPVSGVSGLPAINPQTPAFADVSSLVGESYLLTPTLAAGIASALAAEGGSDNPAVSDYGDFVTSLRSAQGGLSPLEGTPDGGLYEAVRAAGYVPRANPSLSVSAPLAVSFTFTNAGANGWAPSAAAWAAQTVLPEFSSTRFDPFIPVFLMWKVRLDPLKRDDGGGSYDGDNLTSYFELSDSVDYLYKMSGGDPVKFTTGFALDYEGSSVLSSKPSYNLAAQIDWYRSNYPDDPNDGVLKELEDAYKSRRFISQTVSGFSVQQTLRDYIAQIPVVDLPKQAADVITKLIASAADATPHDNWYDFTFNSLRPLYSDPLAQGNFGPLRSGFMGVLSLEIVDAYGQLMQLSTASLNSDGSMQTIAAMPLQPAPGDAANRDKIYLPPRLLSPSRLWFRWLSASHNDDVPGISADFVEMNSQPATSPVCGWVLPNHLDDDLSFYGAGGAAIGSFGLEHGALRYRTRAGNLANPGNDLALDIGAPGTPTVNPHLATLMWHVHGRTAGFLEDLMATILASDGFIHPANFGQDVNLAVLIGRPLAVLRAVLGMETAGGALPLSQADTSASDPFPEDVKAGRFRYADRQKFSSANLGNVAFPAQIGDLARIDDGLVGYLFETGSTDRYGPFYSPAAPAGGGNGVVRPSARTIELTPNAPPLVLTLLVDPRAPVHATTGVLPVEELCIPSDQYSEAMRSLSVTFFTNPVLAERQGLVVPVPQETGYDWAWITPGAPAPIPLKASEANDFAVFDYSPQTILEGWLELAPIATPRPVGGGGPPAGRRSAP